MMKRGKRIKKAMILTTVLILCSGCGRKEVEYDVASDSDVLQSGTGENSGNAGLLTGGIREKIGAEERWEEEMETEDGKKIQIYAEVKIPDVNDVRVFSAKEKDYDGGELKNICETISEGTVYYYDEEHLPKFELETRIGEYQEMLDGILDEDKPRDYFNKISEKLETLRGLYENASEDYIPASEYQAEGDYLVSYLDADYVIGYHSGMDENDDGGQRVLSMYLADEDYTGVISEGKVKSGEKALYYPTYNRIHPDSEKYSTSDNDCGISAEQAEEYAMDFLEEIGLTDFRAVEYYKAEWMPYLEGQYDREPFTDGMTLVLYRFADGIVVDADPYASEESVNPEHEGKERGEFDDSQCNGEYMELCVTQKGVVFFRYINPMQIQSVVADQAEVLNYESMLSAMRQCLLQYDGERTGIYHELELLYFRCKDTEAGVYRIVPVWRLVSRTEEYYISKCIMINAIDGSYIDIANEIYH